MGDRSQLAVKDGKDRVYLYAHWSGSEIYAAAARALQKAPDRHNDSEYLARVVFQEMIGKNTSTTGFGIGTSQHGDIEHPVLVLDCKSGEAYFEQAAYGSPPPEERYKFDEFARRALEGEFDPL